MPLPPDGTTLHLLSPRTITFEDILDFFRALSGREPTPDEVERARRKWMEFEKERQQPR